MTEALTASPGIAVSVLVATYNTGARLSMLVESVRRQSLGLDQLELVLVDDGSTDGTGERIEQLAQTQQWIVARRIENSGWPSRPRNVGLDLARGEFVLVADHDDELFPEALERMVAAARRDGADLVIGKEVRSGARGVGLDALRANRTRPDLFRDDVLQLLTPHKLFRTAFLREHGVRFSETLRRLEDHELIAELFVHDPVVTVVADYPCYRWIIHGDNSSVRLPDPVEYYDALREVLDAVDRWPFGPEVRDAAYALWLRSTVLERFGPQGLRTWPEEYQPRFFTAAREVTVERFPEHLDARLPALFRARVALLRSGDLRGLLGYVEQDRLVSTRPMLVRAEHRGDRLHLEVHTDLVGAHGPVAFERRSEGRVRQRPTGPLPERLAAEVLDITDEVSAARIDLLLHHRKSDVEWLVPTTASVGWRELGDASLAMEIRATAELDVATAALGSPLAPGVWDVVLRTAALGYDSRPRVRVEGTAMPAPLGSGGLLATAYVTEGGRLALRVPSKPVEARPSTARPVARRRRRHAPRVVRLAARLYRRLQRGARPR